MSANSVVGPTVIGGFLLLSGALGLAAAPAVGLAFIFGSIGTGDTMLRQLHVFSSWMPMAVGFSAAAYIAGLGLLRRRSWARGAALIVLLGQLVTSAALAVTLEAGLLAGNVILTALCLAWLLLLPPTRVQHVLLPQVVIQQNRPRLAVLGPAAVGLGLLYVLALLGLLRRAESATAVRDFGLAVLPTCLVAFLVLRNNHGSQGRLGLFFGIVGGTMLSVAFIASAFLPLWVQSTRIQQSENDLLTLLLGVSTQSASGLSAFVLLIRLVLHVFIVGAVFVLAGAASTVPSERLAGTSRSRLLAPLGRASVIAFVLVFQLLQFPVVLDSISTFGWLMISCSVLFAILATTSLSGGAASTRVDPTPGASSASEVALVAIPLSVAIAAVLAPFVATSSGSLPPIRTDSIDSTPAPPATPSPESPVNADASAALGGVAAQAGRPPDLNPVRIGGDLRIPKKTKDVPPVYPAEARAAKVQGVVILEITIDAMGKVIDARVLRSIPLLDRAALEAATKWEFAPTSVQGKPVPVVMSVTVDFKL